MASGGGKMKKEVSAKAQRLSPQTAASSANDNYSYHFFYEIYSADRSFAVRVGSRRPLVEAVARQSPFSFTFSLPGGRTNEKEGNTILSKIHNKRLFVLSD